MDKTPSYNQIKKCKKRNKTNPTKNKQTPKPKNFKNPKTTTIHLILFNIF